jgi:hypothetical protein
LPLAQSGGRRTNAAVAVASAVRETLQLGVLPVHAPLQVEKRQPFAGAALRRVASW